MAEVHSFVGSPLGLFQDALKKREISPKEAEVNKLTLVSPKDINDETKPKFPEVHSAIRIPYHGVMGEELADTGGKQLIRYRFLGNKIGADNNPQRYTQRSASGVGHYLPLGIDWPSVSSDHAVDLFYTEGEFKAIAASKHLGPTIGNAGIRAWKAEDRMHLAPPLEEFVWRGRNVYIIYDADAGCTAKVPLKFELRKALGELTTELVSRGSEVKALYIARTPTFVEGSKLGLDDYFLAGGTREALLATAEAPEQDARMAELFKSWAIYMGEDPKVVNIDSGKSYSVKQMTDLIFPDQRVVGKKEVHLVTLYRQHPQRNEFHRYVFDPAKPSGYVADERIYNLWKGFAVKPSRSEHYEANIATYLKFQYGLWGAGEQEEGACDDVAYFNKWCAHMIQKPWEQTTISPLMQSHVKGIGKSLQGLILRKLIGDGDSESAYAGDIDSLTGLWNDHLARAIFVQVDEASALHANKESKLKGLYSDKTEIRKRFHSNMLIDNYRRIFFTTNDNAPWRIDSDERRWWPKRSPLLTSDGAVDSEWMQFVHSSVLPLLSGGALGDIMSFYADYDISDWNPTAKARATEAMEAIVEAGLTGKQAGAQEVYEKLGDVFITNKSVRAKDVKFWAIMDTMHHDAGGLKAELVLREDGKLISHVVWMRQGHELIMTKRPGKTAALASGQIDKMQAMQMVLSTDTLMNQIRGAFDDSKF